MLTGNNDIGTIASRKMSHMVGNPRKASVFEFNPRRITDEATKYRNDQVEQQRKASSVTINNRIIDTINEDNEDTFDFSVKTVVFTTTFYLEKKFRNISAKGTKTSKYLENHGRSANSGDRDDTGEALA
jgi:hypothetical protein